MHSEYPDACSVNEFQTSWELISKHTVIYPAWYVCFSVEALQSDKKRNNHGQALFVSVSVSSTNGQFKSNPSNPLKCGRCQREIDGYIKASSDVLSPFLRNICRKHVFFFVTFVRDMRTRPHTFFLRGFQMTIQPMTWRYQFDLDWNLFFILYKIDSHLGKPLRTASHSQVIKK